VSRYLVTGSNGFIGTNLTKHLEAMNHEVIGLDYPTDLCYADNLAFYAEQIVHLAAETSVRDSIDHPGKVFLRNCQSTLNILNIAREDESTLTFVSSHAASDPSSPYGASKAACEALCRAYRASYDMDITILRLSNVYGPHSMHKNSVVHRFIRNSILGQPLTIYGDGEQTRDFIHVSDVCDAIYCLDEDSDISYGCPISINDLVEEIGRLTRKFRSTGLTINHAPAILGEIKHVGIYNPRSEVKAFDESLMDTYLWYMDELIK